MKRMRISVKWRASYEYYYHPVMEMPADQWLHVAFTWAPGKGIRAYLNGCDMDVVDSKGYHSVVDRGTPFSEWFPFMLTAAAGTSVDELYIWHDWLSSRQIWPFYIQGGTEWLHMQNLSIIIHPFRALLWFYTGVFCTYRWLSARLQ